MDNTLLYTVDNFIPYLDSRLDRVRNQEVSWCTEHELFVSELNRYNNFEDVWLKRSWQHALLTVFHDIVPLESLYHTHTICQQQDWMENLFYSTKTDQWWEVLAAIPSQWVDALTLPRLCYWTGSLTPHLLGRLYHRGWMTDDGLAHFYMNGERFGGHCTMPFLHMLLLDHIKFDDIVGNRNQPEVQAKIKAFKKHYEGFEWLYGPIPETEILPVTYSRLRWCDGDATLPSEKSTPLLW